LWRDPAEVTAEGMVRFYRRRCIVRGWRSSIFGPFGQVSRRYGLDGNKGKGTQGLGFEVGSYATCSIITGGELQRQLSVAASTNAQTGSYVHQCQFVLDDFDSKILFSLSRRGDFLECYVVASVNALTLGVSELEMYITSYS